MQPHTVSPSAKHAFRLFFSFAFHKHACSSITSSRWLDNPHQFESAKENPHHPQPHFWLSSQESSGCYQPERAPVSARGWKLEGPSSPLLAHIWVLSPFKTPHICGWLFPETSYLHAAGNGERKFSGRWRWYGKWRSWRWESVDVEQCGGNGLTQASLVCPSARLW